MTGRHLIGLLLVALVLAPCADAVEYKRDRYDVIVDRSPFGEDPLVIEAAATKAKEDKAAAAAAKRMESQIRLCYLLETDTGEIRAGFHNKAAKSGDPKSIMLTVGESFLGMKLEKIDVENASATLMMSGKPVTFVLTKAAPAKQTVAKKAPTVPQRRFGGGFRRKEEPKPEPEPPKPQLTPEEEQARREEIRENLQNYQEEVIRQGMPALPIPLTQEQDDRLVAEGVLPPLEEPAQ